MKCGMRSAECGVINHDSAVPFDVRARNVIARFDQRPNARLLHSAVRTPHSAIKEGLI